MTTIHHLTNKAIAVTGLPEGAYEFHYYPEDDTTNDVSVLEWKEPIQKIGSFIKDSGHLIMPEGDWRILGFSQDLTEDQKAEHEPLLKSKDLDPLLNHLILIQ